MQQNHEKIYYRVAQRCATPAAVQLHRAGQNAALINRRSDEGTPPCSPPLPLKPKNWIIKESLFKHQNTGLRLSVTLVQFREFREVLMPGCVCFFLLFFSTWFSKPSEPTFFLKGANAAQQCHNVGFVLVNGLLEGGVAETAVGSERQA